MFSTRQIQGHGDTDVQKIACFKQMSATPEIFANELKYS